MRTRRVGRRGNQRGLDPRQSDALILPHEPTPPGSRQRPRGAAGSGSRSLGATRAPADAPPIEAGSKQRRRGPMRHAPNETKWALSRPYPAMHAGSRGHPCSSAPMPVRPDATRPHGSPNSLRPGRIARRRPTRGPLLRSGAVNSQEPRTIVEKIWDEHVVAQEPDAPAVLAIDLHLIHEVTSPQAFTGLRERGLPSAIPSGRSRPRTTPPRPTPKPADPRPHGRRTRSSSSRGTARSSGSRSTAWGSANQGIVHVIGPELGLTQPGMTIVCGDSHTATHGAFGALAFGIGTSEVEMVLATQTLLQRKPKTYEVRVNGRLSRASRRRTSSSPDRPDRHRRRHRPRLRVHAARPSAR